VARHQNAEKSHSLLMVWQSSSIWE